jgi:hypothetical protein
MDGEDAGRRCHCPPGDVVGCSAISDRSCYYVLVVLLSMHHHFPSRELIGCLLPESLEARVAQEAIEAGARD